MLQHFAADVAGFDNTNCSESTPNSSLQQPMMYFLTLKSHHQVEYFTMILSCKYLPFSSDCSYLDSYCDSSCTNAEAQDL